MRPLALVLALAFPARAVDVSTSAPSVRPSSSTIQLTEQQIEERLGELYEALRVGRYEVERHSNPSEDFLAAVTFDRGDSKWYTMSLTASQWRRWYHKAQAWKEDAHLRRMYDDDIGRYSGSIRGTQIAAIVDVLVVRLHQMYPNRFTRVMIDGMQLYEKVTKELPVDLRDDFRDRFRDWVDDRRRSFEYDPQLDEPVPGRVASREDSEPEASRLSRLGRTVRELEPRVTLKLRPRFELEDPRPKVGAGLSLRLSESWRFKLEGEYDTRSSERGCVFGFGCNF